MTDTWATCIKIMSFIIILASWFHELLTVPQSADNGVLVNE
jgi:hypothetical protein